MREDEIRDLIKDLRVEQEESPDGNQDVASSGDQDVSITGNQEEGECKSCELDELLDRLEKVLDRLDRILGDDQEQEESPAEVIEYRELPRRISAKESYNRSRHYRRVCR